MQTRELKSGEILFREGDKSDLAYLVDSGAVEILSGYPSDIRRLAVIGPGEVFGEMSLVEDRPRSLTARVVTAGQATTLGRQDFEQYLLQDPQKCRRYLRSLFERLRELNARLEEQERDRPLRSAATGTEVWLFPLTPRAAAALSEKGYRVDRFPFRMGRAAEPHEQEALDLNDLWLLDSRPFRVSRNHLAIDLVDDRVVVIDRGSYLGTIVNDQVIGGKRQVRERPLKDGDNVLVVGDAQSPFQFKIQVKRTAVQNVQTHRPEDQAVVSEQPG